MEEITDSYWLFGLFGLLLAALLFVFFWTTPYNEDEARKK